MANTMPLIAFCGATGRSTISALVPALKAGYDCTALIRNPSKSTSLLEKGLPEKGLPQSTISTHLTITQGDILNASNCTKPLPLNNRTANIIISTIGVPPTSPEIIVCTTAATNVLSALPFLPAPASGKKPSSSRSPPPAYQTDAATSRSYSRRYITCSWRIRTGVRGIYMERVIAEQTDHFVIVKPSLLTKGRALGG